MQMNDGVLFQVIARVVTFEEGARFAMPSLTSGPASAADITSASRRRCLESHQGLRLPL